MSDKEKHFVFIKEEVARHLEDAEVSKLSHWNAASVYEKRHKLFIGLPALLISMLLTWILSGDAKTILSKNEYFSWIPGTLPIVLSPIVSVLTGLGAFLNFNERAAKHRAAAENLNSLWRDCKNWDSDFPDSTYCESAKQTIQTYRKRLNEINRDAPQIPKWAWKSVQRQRNEGSTSYQDED